MSKPDKPAGIYQVAQTPMLISIVVLLVRLVGELAGFEVDVGGVNLFDTGAGGGGSPLGASWLILPVGFWFGWRWTGQRRAPDRPGLAAALFVFAALIFGGTMGLAMGVFDLKIPMLTYVMSGAALAAFAIGLRAWPRFTLTMLVYAYGVRLIVVALTYALFFLGADTDTHFTKFGPGIEVPESKYDQALVLSTAQVTFWPVATLVFGGLAGVVASLMRGRRKDDHQDI